jgi:adenylate kinase family enzyme
MGHPHVELDHLFWLPGWQRAQETDFTARVATATEAARWIVDGQYEAAHPILRDRADLVIWLDPPLIVSFGRLIRRTWRRLRRREPLFNGDLETVAGAMELLWWALRQHRAVRSLNKSLQRHIIARGGTFLRVRSVSALWLGQ